DRGKTWSSIPRTFRGAVRAGERPVLWRISDADRARAGKPDAPGAGGRHRGPRGAPRALPGVSGPAGPAPDRPPLPGQGGPVRPRPGDVPGGPPGLLTVPRAARGGAGRPATGGPGRHTRR